MTSKQDLRRLFRQRRQEQLSLGSVICRQVQTLVQASPVRTGHLGLYWPLNGEVDLRTIRLAISNEVALPFADGCGGLHYRHWTDTPLEADGCGIPAPNVGPPLDADQLGLLLVPALAIDQSGIRLGYGGGYYDRLRQQPPWRAVPSLVVLPSACITPTPLPQAPWDIAFDGWISEKGPGRPTRTAAS